jgi:pimeloyl-ACP methyl ester carboxylesterase
MKTIIFRNKKIRFTDQGTGKTLVLLHGFTEDGGIWDGFCVRLNRDFRVIVIDLPGHGESEGIDAIHTMELQAEVVHEVLKSCKVRKCLMTGHSMGGYVTLAFAEKYPNMLKGICLFHSHVFPDSPQDRENRERTIRIVKEDKFGFVVQFIHSLFPEEVQNKFRKEIEHLIGRAKKLKKENIVAALEGMKIRKDHVKLLENMQIPILFILGQKDIKIPVSRYWEMISLPRYSESLILRDTGHMGYIEEPEQTLKVLKGFARKVLA